MLTDDQKNPVLGAPPYIDMDNPDVRAKILGLPAPMAQPKTSAPTIVGAPTAPKSDIANVPPTMEKAPTAAPSSSTPATAPAVAPPSGAAKIAADQEHQLAIDKFKQAHPWGSAPSAEIDPSTGQAFAGNHAGKLGKFLHGIATVGNVAGDIFAPAVTAAIPGSELGRKAAIAQETKTGLGAEKQASEENLQSAEATKDRNTTTPGKTNAEQAFNDLMTGDNGKPRINPDTKKPYLPIEADAAVKQAEDTKVTDPMKQPVGDAGITQPNAQLAQIGSAINMNPTQQQQFNDAYSIKPTDTGEEANKKLENAKGVAQLTGAERDRKIAEDAQKQNHADAQANIAENRDLETVQYKGKDGALHIGSYEDAQAAGGTSIRKSQPGVEDKARVEQTQFSRWIDNAQKASDTMPAWDNAQDKELSTRVMHKFFADVSAHIPAVGGAGVDPDYLNAMENLEDYKKLTPAGQEHLQNMFTVWSDAINLMKSETGGVPRGEHFLKLESAILPQPEKTQAMNRQSLKQFESRIRKDAQGIPRPDDMGPLPKITPPGAPAVGTVVNGHTFTGGDPHEQDNWETEKKK